MLSGCSQCINGICLCSGSDLRDSVEPVGGGSDLHTPRRAAGIPAETSVPGGSFHQETLGTDLNTFILMCLIS